MKLNLLAARILCALLTAFTALSASAYSFEVDGIYYSISSNTNTKKTVDVTYKDFQNPDNYSGAITIPPTVTYNGNVFSVTGISNYAFYGCTGLTSVKIPESVNYMGMSAFSGCTSLSSFSFPESIISIGQQMFADCTALKEVTFTETSNLTSIPLRTFLGCKSLISLRLPESVTSIGNYAFYGCTELVSIKIPESVISIDFIAFGQCSKLDNIILPSKLEKIANTTFDGCSSLTSITIPESVKTIEDAALIRCKSLQEIKLPNSVETMGEWTFAYCSSLKTIEIGTGIQQIGRFAFEGCGNLDLVTVLAVEPPTAVEVPANSQQGTFMKSQYDTTNLRVPYESIEKYRTAPVWENFFKDRNPLTAIEGVEAAEGAESEVVARYDLSGRPVADDYRGMTIVRRADGSTAKGILR